MIETSNSNVGFEEHERLVGFLDTMAIMLGCIQTLNSQLPDFTRPDVVRLNTQSNLLFIGDAKNTEKPDSSYTQERLYNYILWLPSFLWNNDERKVVFAICHNKRENIHPWSITLTSLLSRSNIALIKYGVEAFDSLTYIAWAQAKGSNKVLIPNQ